METKGNPVDSVIQYQLHKKISGEGGDSFKCNYIGYKILNEHSTELTMAEIEELADDDIYLIALDNLAPGWLFIQRVAKCEIDASFDELLKCNKIFRDSEGSLIQANLSFSYFNVDTKLVYNVNLEDTNYYYSYDINEKMYYYLIDASYQEN